MKAGFLPGEPFPSLFTPLYYLEALLRRGSYGFFAAEIISHGVRGSILDVGTGPGLLPLELVRRSPEVRVVGVDPSPGMIALAKRLCGGKVGGDRVRFVVGGVYRLPFPPSSFDMVVSVGVIHHLLDFRRALQEIHRVLKPGGEAWLYEVIMDVEWSEVVAALKEMGVPLFPTCFLFFIHRVLSRMVGGRRLVGMRKEDLEDLRVPKGEGFSWKMERKGPLLKIVLRKGKR